MKNISILGSTGSIGTQTLQVVREHPDKFNVVGLSCYQNLDLVEQQIREFHPKLVTVMNPMDALELKKRVSSFNVEILSGMEGLISVATIDSADLIVNAVVGMIGLLPTIKAIQNNKNIALANKETLVTAGAIVMEQAAKHDVKIIPIDSEHSAIFQCLIGYNLKDVNRIILTASGGPFRGFDKARLNNVTVSEALKHPKWNMGKKISIDSATLMNKGLEVIEAKWLFDLTVDQIDVVIHPQSIIHSMVEYNDSSIISQMGYPDMRVPIQFALTYPDRIKNEYKKLDFFDVKTLTFEKPDTDTFPCLRMAYEALKIGASLPTVLNAANEVLVDRFIKGDIGFYDIPKLIEYALERHTLNYSASIEDILAIDQWTRKLIENIKI